MIEEKQWISSEVLFAAIAEQLAAGRQAAFTVTGMSMWPFLCHGRDQVIVGRAERASLRRGDIVLYQTAEGRYILHRITKLGGDTFQTTGDGNFFRDPKMPFANIAARAEGVIRNGRTIACSDWRWKMLSEVWMLLYPFRRGMFFVWFRVLRRWVRK